MKKILVTAFACLSIASVYAENFSVEFVNVGNFHIADIKSGKDTYASWHVNTVNVVTKSGSEMFPLNGIMTGTCIGTSKTVSGSTLTEADCVTKDSSGDEFTGHLVRDGVVGGPPTQGSQTVKGLSGKFIGLTGKCTYIPTTFKTAEGIQNVSIGKCDYQK
jgi:hypothetical protein